MEGSNQEWPSMTQPKHAHHGQEDPAARDGSYHLPLLTHAFVCVCACVCALVLGSGGVKLQLLLLVVVGDEDGRVWV